MVETQEEMQGQHFHSVKSFDVHDIWILIAAVRIVLFYHCIILKGHSLETMIHAPLLKYNEENKTDFQVKDVCCCTCTCFYIFCIIVFGDSVWKKSVTCLPIFYNFCEYFNKICTNTSLRIFEYLNHEPCWVVKSMYFHSC